MHSHNCNEIYTAVRIAIAAMDRPVTAFPSFAT
jgi:hypothetical protein